MRSPDPTSRTVVKPASTTARALTAAPMACSATSRRKPLTNAWFQSSLYSPVRWVWASMNPGAERRVAQVDHAGPPRGSARSAPAATIFEPSTRTTPRRHQLVRLAVEEPGGLDRRDGRLLLLGQEPEGGDQGSDSRPRREPASVSSCASFSRQVGRSESLPKRHIMRKEPRHHHSCAPQTIRSWRPVAAAIQTMIESANCAANGPVISSAYSVAVSHSGSTTGRID